MLEIIQSVAIIAIGAVVVTKEFPRVLPRKNKQKVAILDSCALIDGRVVELAKAGFVPYDLAVPEFIVAELQLLADGSDSHKRERARFGLEVIQQLQHEADISLNIERTKVQAKTTDDKLVKLAKKINAELFTTDYNLNQVATIEGVRVLNVNELSHALRPVALPGEAFEVKVTQPGSNRDQGVGYMEDGTMIVIDGARKDIGKTVKVRITRTHQTVAGKMLFASRVSEPKQQRIASPSDNLRQKAAKPEPKRTGLRTRPKPATATANSTLQRSRSNHRPKSDNYRAGATKGEASLLSAIEDMSNN